MNKFLITHMATKRSAPLFAAAVESERNRLDYIAQSAATTKGRAAPFPPSSSAATTPLSLVAGELEPDYASEQSPVSDEELREGFDMKYGG